MPETPSAQPAQHPASRLWGAILAAAIFCWGTYIAVGAYLADDQRRPGKPLIIFGCTLFFVALWTFVWRAASRKKH